MTSKPDFPYVVDAVLNMYEEYDFKKIDVFEMVNKLVIKLIPYSALNKIKQQECLKVSTDGFSLESSGQWYIYYNDNIDNFGRVKFTIMHEIGHYILGHSGKGEFEEQEANCFAKYALAPPPLIHQLPYVEVSSIQNEFEISFEAALYAYNYYLKWLRFGGDSYTEQEKKLIERFKIA